MGRVTEQDQESEVPSVYDGVPVPESVSSAWGEPLALGWRIGVIDAHMAAVTKQLTGTLKYPCGLCKWKFSIRVSLDQHISKVHGVDRG